MESSRSNLLLSEDFRLFHGMRSLIICWYMQDLIEKAEKQPNMTLGVLVALAVVILSVFFRVIFGRKKKVLSSLGPFAYHEIDPLHLSSEIFTYVGFTMILTIGIAG